MDIFTTMITPFTADGEVDYDTAKRYVDWYFENGLTGIFAVCQSSEIFYLSLEERVKLNRLVYERAKALEKEHGRRFTVVSSGLSGFCFISISRASVILSTTISCASFFLAIVLHFLFLCFS